MAVLGVAGLSVVSAFAGSATYDFTDDPSSILTIGGNNPSVWSSEGGNPGGYLSITDAVNGQNSIIIFPDFDNGTVVKAFSFSCDLRVGNATGNDGRPADGFSVNYARSGDPIFNDPPDANNFAAPGQPENGTKTGIAIGFDTWSGNTLPDGSDIEGIIVRVDNVTVLKQPMTTRNGACEDATSLQTGPYNADTAGDPSGLCWAKLQVDLNESAQLTVKWKGTTLLNNTQTSFFPSSGRLVLAGRTGGANENNHVDNISITTVPAEKALMTGVTGGPISVVATLDDAGASIVDTTTIAATLDGAPISVSSTKSGKVTTVTYNSATPMPSGAAHTLDVAFKDTRGVAVTSSRAFNTIVYALVPAANAQPAGAVNKTKPGFLIHPYTTEEANPNTLAWTEEQLFGQHGANLADLTGADANGFYAADTVVNFDIDEANVQGNFGDELPFPGLPGAQTQDQGTGNATMDIETYIEFPAAGVYTMGVNSDDGFKLSTAPGVGDVLGLVCGSFDGGRGASDTLFTLLIQQAGIYPVRLLWENGNGGCNVEWFSVDSGEKILVNDTTNPKALKAYQTTTAAVAYVSGALPGPSTGVFADTDLIVELTDGVKPVNDSSIVLTLNGTTLSPTITNSGKKTTAKVVSTSPLPSGSTNHVTLAFSDGSRSFSYAWDFVVGVYSALPSEIASPLGSEDSSKPGFKARIYQVNQTGSNGLPNRFERAEQQLAGLIDVNVADLTAAKNGIFEITDVINFNQDAPTGIGNFGDDQTIPGIPGTGDAAYNTDMVAGEFITYIAFPKAGYYRMGVNSDDGFRTTATDAPPKDNLALVVSGPGVAGSYYSITAGYVGTSKPFTTGVSGKLVAADPILAGGTLANADAIRGNIAVCRRGTYQFSAKLRFCREAGAAAVVVVNNRPDANPAEGWFPIEMGIGADGYQDIPAIMLAQRDGDIILNAIGNGLTASITPDSTPALGLFNDGRGASDTIFNFTVPKAGVYPFRTIWWEGGGGSNVEWFMLNKDGSKTLLNDPNSASALKCYRARTFTPPANPTIAIAVDGANAVITFTGTLQAADSVSGPYTDVSGATSPKTVSVSGGAMKFWRARQ